MKQIITFIWLLCLAFQPLKAQNEASLLSYKAQANAKIQEIQRKRIKLDSMQVKKLKQVFIVHQKTSDSIAGSKVDAKQMAKLNEHNDKKWHTTLMNTFTDQQRLSYLTALARPQVDTIANAKIALLRKSGSYSEQELQQKRKEIAAYYTQEQVVLLRDQYDVSKRRENQRWLRTLRPKSVKECDYLEKLQNAGALKDGKIVW
jgi:hypothetical protein